MKDSARKTRRLDKRKLPIPFMANQKRHGVTPNGPCHQSSTSLFIYMAAPKSMMAEKRRIVEVQLFLKFAPSHAGFRNDSE
jgi:hypothetical protein